MSSHLANDRSKEWPGFSPGSFKMISITVLVLLLFLSSLLFLLPDKEVEPIALARSQPQVIAALPLIFDTDDPEHGYFASQLRHELVERLALSTSHDIFLLNRPLSSSSLQIDLNLDGLINVVNDEIVATIRLTDVKTNQLIWLRLYRQSQQDFLKIPAAVHHDLHVYFTGTQLPEQKPQPLNGVLQHAYLKGRYYMRKESARTRRKALPYLKLVERLQPDYAPAHAALAHLFSMDDHHSGLSQSKRRRLARHHLEQGLALNEELAELHLVRGTILFQNEWRSSDAERSFRKARRLYPNDMALLQQFGLFLAATNRPKEALPLIEKAFEIDSQSATVQFNLAQVYLMNGNLAGARDILERLTKTHVHFSAGQVYRYLCRDQSQERDTRKAQTRWIADLPDVSRLKLEFAKLGSVHSLSPRGRRRDLRRRQFTETHAAVTFATMCLQAGQKELAFSWLERSQDMREAQLLYMINTPLFESLHKEPRFQAIRSNLGLNFKL